MADNPYINKVEANNQTLIDLTSDTATAGDVLAGRTLHLASGAPATGTYRPSDEIEARLESTVGHSCKNLLEIVRSSDTVNGVDFTIDKISGTITANGTATATISFGLNVPSSVNGKVYLSCQSMGGSSQTYYLYAYDNTDRSKCKNWDKTDNSADCYGESVEVFIEQGHNTRIFIQIKKGCQVGNIVFKPMLRDGRISDDTFEPYVTPTDEKKQDKPVVLWEADIGSTGVQSVALSALSQPITNFSALKIMVCNCFGSATITALDTYLAFIEVDLSLSNENYGWCCTTFLGVHSESGQSKVDHIHAFAAIDNSSISIDGYLNNVTAPDGNGIAGTFIRKIIGIP